MTSGIVSALDRPVDTGAASGQGSVFPAIQTDAAINPGNSGGALVDLSGDVVGINTAIRTDGSTVGAEGGSIGLGFAIPIDEARPIVAQLAKGETPTHARIGVTRQRRGRRPSGVTTTGAKVEEVTAGSAGDEAGLAQGDVITAVDGEPVTGADGLVATIRKYRPGDEVTLTYQRGGESEQVTRHAGQRRGHPDHLTRTRPLTATSELCRPAYGADIGQSQRGRRARCSRGQAPRAARIRASLSRVSAYSSSALLSTVTPPPVPAV